MTFATADLCDAHPEAAVVDPQLDLTSFGGATMFHGPISTVRCFEDNSLVRDAVAEPGAGRVLVVDGGGSPRCALLGDRLASLAAANGWAGVVVNGCVRDAAELALIDLGVHARGTHPRRSVKRGEGERDVTAIFGGVRFQPGRWLYADSDGILVLDAPADPT